MLSRNPGIATLRLNGNEAVSRDSPSTRTGKGVFLSARRSVVPSVPSVPSGPSVRLECVSERHRRQSLPGVFLNDFLYTVLEKVLRCLPWRAGGQIGVAASPREEVARNGGGAAAARGQRPRGAGGAAAPRNSGAFPYEAPRKVVRFMMAPPPNWPPKHFNSCISKVLFTEILRNLF